MASTVSAANLKVKITEEIILNGKDQGGTTELTIASINEVSKRIVTTDSTNSTTVVSFSTVSAGGQWVESDVRYIRITNLDDTNFAILNIEGDASTDFSVRLDPYVSFLVTSTSTTGVVDYGDITGVTLEDLTAIKATADTAAVDLEIFVAAA